MRPLALLVFFYSLVACYGSTAIHAPQSEPPRFYYDPDFTQEELGWIREAAQHWCRAAQVRSACPELVGPATWPQPRIRQAGKPLSGATPRDPEPTIWRSTGGDSLSPAGQYSNAERTRAPRRGEVLDDGFTDGRSIVLFADNQDSPDDWVQTTLHEFGHILGIDDDETPAMRIHLSCIDIETLERLCMQHWCGRHAKPTCPNDAGRSIKTWDMTAR